MGRPEDDIWALHTLEPTLPNKKWKCKHCKKEFAGSATRVREHLFAEAGKNISRCSVFNLSSDNGEKGEMSGDKELNGMGQKKEANRSFNKRRRNSSSRDNVSHQAGNIPTTVASVVTNTQESTDDLLIKFLMSNNLPLNRIKDPFLVSLLTRVAQDGVPSCIHRDDKLVIHKSLFNWEHQVNEYMLSVKESWGRTGCTLIRYNFNLENDNLIYGFYSPKGFIFVQGPRSDSLHHIRDALKNNLLNLSFDDVTRCINHHHDFCACELAYNPDEECIPFGSIFGCVSHVMQALWDEICKKSEWVEKLIQTSEKVYKLLLSHPDASTARLQELFKKHRDGMAMTSFALLKSIMHLKDEKVLTSKEIWLDVESTIDNEDFWEVGKKLIRALNPLLEVAHLVDTLCPVAAYIYTAIDRALRNLRTCYDSDPHKFQQIWDCFGEYYFDQQEDYNLQLDFFSLTYNIIDVVEMLPDINPELEEELHRYKSGNPFQKVSNFWLWQNHPVKLWEEYGSEFPMLKARAIKELSVAGSCMCNQIKKKLEQIQGCDNVLMRLNYMMMEELQKLGDSIYKPPPKWVAEEHYIFNQFDE